MPWRRQPQQKLRALALGFACVAIDLSEAKCQKGSHKVDNSCRTCPSGYYQDQEGKSSCKACSTGKGDLAPTEGRERKCSDCPPGRFDNAQEQSRYCEECPLATYQDVKKQTVCKSCTAGRGMIEDQRARTEICPECPAGYYFDFEIVGQCGDCPKGYYQDNAAEESCLKCPEGWYQNRRKKLSCESCLAGQFSAIEGKSACTDCPIGYFTLDRENGGDLTECSACMSGMSSAEGSTYCQNCDTGRYANAQGSSCKVCQPGDYQSARGQESCKPCGKGKFSANTEAVECNQCPAQSYQDQMGFAECLPCPTGWSNDAQGQPACNDDSVSYSECVVGQYNKDGVCETCPAGKYSESTTVTSCLDCEVGKYLSDDQSNNELHDAASDCLDCEVGRYMADQGASFCVSCLQGKYQDETGQSECEPCPEGSFLYVEHTVSTDEQQDEASDCKVCPNGWINPIIGQSACYACPEGKFNNESMISGKVFASHDHENDCKICPNGRFTEFTNTTKSCTLCPAGYFAKESAKSCNDCQRGRYRDIPGGHFPQWSACHICTGGQYQDEYGQLACKNCKAGRYISRADILSHLEEADCQVCLPGMYTSNVAATACLDCPKGRFLARDMAVLDRNLHDSINDCQICPQGRYNEIDGLDNECSACDAGMFLADLGTDPAAHDNMHEDCQVCQAGMVSALLGAASCTSCAPGLYNPHDDSLATNHEMCLECPRGYFTGGSGTGQIECAPCTSGLFLNYIGATSSAACIPCEKGFFSVDEATLECSACIRGRYGILEGGTNAAEACRDCAAGMSSEVGQADNCTNCSVGMFLPPEVAGQGAACLTCASATKEGQSFCEGCPPGRWGIEPDCVDCEAGRFSGGGQSSGCKVCPAGYVGFVRTPRPLLLEGIKNTVAMNRSLCEACPPGTYSEDEEAADLSACKPCGLGRHGNNIEAATSPQQCSDCGRGRYSTLEISEGDWNCLLCEAGRVSNQLARHIPCDGCVPGRYSTMPGETSPCKNCPGGWSAVAANASVCTICLPGFAQASPAGIECAECREGRISSSTGSLSCDQCLAGFFQDRKAQALCLPCIPGKLAPRRSATVCAKCIPGTYLDVLAFNGTSCTPCPKGMYQPNDGATACIACIPGTKAAVASSQVCALCEEGRYAENEQHRSDCTACLPGYYQGDTGASSCMKCLPGWHQVASAQTSCDECDTGRFTSAVASGEACHECPSGFYQNEKGRASCEACQAGFYQAVSGQTKCLACPKGFFSQNSAAKMCNLCQLGRYAPNKRSTMCLMCVAGKAGGDNATCVECTPGRFRGPRDSISTCLDCPSGYATTLKQQSLCQQCPVGKVSSSLRDTCESCAPGMFRGMEDDACVHCSPGFHADVAGSAFCFACEIGKFGATSGTDVCADCPVGMFQDEKRSLSCKECIGGLVPNNRRTSCERPPWKIPSDCKAGVEFLNDTSSEWEAWTCEICPDFAVCRGHVTWNDVIPEEGCKRLRHNPNFFAPCNVASACSWETIRTSPVDNGANTSDLNASSRDLYSSCSHGHDPLSELCSQCIEGWSMQRVGDPCTECPSLGTTVGLFVSMLLLVILVFCALVSDSLSGAADMIPRGNNDTKHATEMPFHSIAIRILSSYMQVSGMLLSFDLYVPEAVRTLVVAQSSVSSLGEQLLNIDCMATSRVDESLFFLKQIMSAWVLPSVAMVVIAMFWWWRHCFCQRDGNDDEEHILRTIVTKTKPKKKQGKALPSGSTKDSLETSNRSPLSIKEVVVFVPSVDGFMTSIVVLFYTLYPSLVNRMALTFSCVSWDHGTTDVLTKAMSVKCWTPEHMTLIFQVGIPGLLLYMLLIPAWISLTLRYQRSRGHLYPHQNRYEPRWTMRFSFMFAGYREGFEWWESIVMARKCLFVLMAIFLRLYGPSAQVLAASIVLCLAISLHLQYRPYFDQGLNWLESMSLQVSLSQLLTSILANVLTHGRANAGGARVSSTSAMGPVANLVVIIFFFTTTLTFFLAAIRETVRGSYETKGCVGDLARCCVRHCHKHVFGSHTVKKRNKKARRHSRKQKKGTRNIFGKFFRAVDNGVRQSTVQHVEEEHEKSINKFSHRVETRGEDSHRRLQQRLEKRNTQPRVNLPAGLQ